MAQDSCRLCLIATPVADNKTIMCFGPALTSADAGTVKYTVAEILIKHFWFELHSDRDANAFVCQSCWHKVDTFHQFYQSVLAVHQTRWPTSTPPPTKPYDEHFVNVDEKLLITMDEASSDDDDYNGAFEDIKLEQHDRDEDCLQMDAEKPTPSSARRSHRPHKTDSPVVTIKAEATSDDEQPTRKPTATRSPAETPAAIKQLAEYFTLQCDVCAAPLSNLAAAHTHHQQAHQQRGYLTCGCGQRFMRSAAIREHCVFHADPSQFKCMECCRIFTSHGRLNLHRNVKHPVAMAGGDTATTATSSTLTSTPPKEQSLAKQRLDDELIRRFIGMFCSQCGVTYGTFEEARQHHQQVHNQTGFVECCGRRFSKKCLAVNHCRWHDNPRDFDCTICGRNFNDKDGLRVHTIRRHPTTAPYIYKCDACDQSFQLNQQLRTHQRRVHDTKKFECYRCHRQYVFLSQLRSHLRYVHDAAPTHVCDVCARCFKTKVSYDLHYALHHGTVSLKRQCLECGKWLKHAAMLAVHMRTHRSVAQTCTECGHVAPNRRTLNAHRRQMHRAPQFKCMACGKLFKKLLTLKEHMAIHAGIKDLYTCAYCPKTFRSMANMYTHRRQMHAAQFEADKNQANARNAAEAAAAVAAAAAAGVKRT